MVLYLAFAVLASTNIPYITMVPHHTNQHRTNKLPVWVLNLNFELLMTLWLWLLLELEFLTPYKYQLEALTSVCVCVKDVKFQA